MRDVSEWLEQLGLGHLTHVFRQNDIDVEVLRTLTDTDLKELGIGSLGARRKILHNAAKIFPAARSATVTSSIRGGEAPSDAADDEIPWTEDATPLADDLASAATAFVPLPGSAPGSGNVARGHKLKGRYYVVGELGAGAMGIVYRAVDEVLGRDVAVKTLLTEHTSNPALVAQMAKEVALAQEVTHPKLLRIHTFEPGPPPFLVMEYIDGETLQERAQAHGGKLPVAEVQRILGDVLEGLEVLHAARIVHRDVKPANVLLGKTGAVKLADYGVAATVRDQLRGAPQAGTLPYMAPELLRGGRADTRSDLYAVGMMAFELCVGRLPFTTCSPQEIAQWHLWSTRDLSLMQGSVLHEVVRRALQPEPLQRWSTAAEMRTALIDAERLAVKLAEEARRAEEVRREEESQRAEEAYITWALSEARRLEEAKKAEEARRAEEARKARDRCETVQPGSLYQNAVASFARLPGIDPERAASHGKWFSVNLLLADALTEAVVSHLRDTAAANPDFQMPDVRDPAVICRTVFEFFDGRLKEGDGLQLQLLSADSPEEHPLVKKGQKQECGYGALLNAMNLMLRVPSVADHTVTPYHDIVCDKRFFFHDLAGMENWLRVRGSYTPASNEMNLFYHRWSK